MFKRAKLSRRRSVQHYAVVGINMLLIGAALSAATLIYYANEQASAISRVSLVGSLVDVGDVQGERVMNILLVGSDSSANLDQDDPIQAGRQGQRLGDVIIIAHIDERSGDLALLSLPRDLWVDIPGSSQSNRINKAFEAGGPSLLIDTIEANFQIPIHHFVNVDFAGFQGLVEAVGTVDIHFEEPARDWNTTVDPPRSQTGFSVSQPGCQALGPEQALAYVRSRFYQTQGADGQWRTDPTADLGRIRRQQDFLRQLMERSIELGARNPLVLNDLMSTGLDHVIIDESLTPALIKDLATNYSGFEPTSLQTFSLPAIDSRVGSRQVLLPDPDDVEPVLALFRGSGFESSATVLVEMLSPSGDASGSLSDSLQGKGYTVNQVTRSRVTMVDGVDFILRHGPDGLQAAQALAADINGNIALAQIDNISGRTVQLVTVSEYSGGADTSANSTVVDTPQDTVVDQGSTAGVATTNSVQIIPSGAINSSVCS